MSCRGVSNQVSFHFNDNLGIHYRNNHFSYLCRISNKPLTIKYNTSYILNNYTHAFGRVLNFYG